MKSKIIPELNVPNRTIYTADNLAVLRSINTETIDLIYLDPPFNTGKTWSNPIHAKGKKAEASFEDTWKWGDEHEDVVRQLVNTEQKKIIRLVEGLAEVNGNSWKAYLIYMGVRLIEMHRILKPTGSIYFHCDPVMSHGIKLVMDAVFGKANFRNEVVWGYKKWTNKTKSFQSNHDIILLYNKSQKYVFNKPYGELTRRQVQLRQTGYNRGSTSGVPILRVYDNEKAAHQIAVAKKEGRKVYYVDNPPAGEPMSDVWPISSINGQAKERTGYPTQKPLALLDVIINASSDKEGIVLDPFCGCATACVAAERWGRRWIGIDLSGLASGILIDRLEKINPEDKGGLRAIDVNWAVHSSCGKSVDSCIEDWNPASKENSKLLAEMKLAEAKKTGDEMQDIYDRLLKLAKEKGVNKDLPKRTDLPSLPYNWKANQYATQHHKCIACGKKKDIEDMQMDHYIPKAKGGQDETFNLLLLCSKCNRDKSNKPLTTLRKNIKAKRAAEEDKRDDDEFDTRMGDASS